MDLAWFKDYEPLRNIGFAPDYPPTFLLHGEADTDVPFEQSRLMAAAFEKHNVPFEFVSRSEWNHVFDVNLGLDNESVADAYERIATFLDQHLK